MKLFFNGNVHEFHGHPTKKNLVQFVEKKTGPISTEITSDDVFNNLPKHDLAIAYFGDDDEDFKTFERMAAKHEDIEFFHSFDTKYYNLNNQVKVTMFKSFDGGKKSE